MDCGYLLWSYATKEQSWKMYFFIRKNNYFIRDEKFFITFFHKNIQNKAVYYSRNDQIE